jgi:hypothetical protein
MSDLVRGQAPQQIITQIVEASELPTAQDALAACLQAACS